MTQFVHLHCHSEYSIIDSIVPIPTLCEQAHKMAMPALALTDVCNLFAMVKFYRAAIQYGIKPIIGAELWLENEDQNFPFSKLVLLCQNREGYLHLTELISKAYQKGKRLNIPLIKKSWLNENSGLIALSGGQFGEIGQALVQGNDKKAEILLKEWQNLFPNRFYLEWQRNQRPFEKTYEAKLLPLAHQFSCPLVATNEVIIMERQDFEAHKARVCIQEGATLEHWVNHQGYTEFQTLRSPEEMQKLYQDVPEALLNTVEIAKRCNLLLTLDEPILPSFPVPENLSEEQLLKKQSQQGLEHRLDFKFQLKNYGKEQILEIREAYQARLDEELAVITRMGFSGYFLIVADFIHWAKQNGIPVGPGRGSGAGSLVAYVLLITDLDPIEFDLLFERFLNPDRVSMPDFDIDFCMDNRDRVIDYVSNRYGKESVSQIVTFGTMAAKAVVRDVGRVLGHPYGFVDKIAKLIPFEIGITLEKALEQEPSLQKRYQEEEEVKNLINLAKKLEGITRNVGKHAGGVVIAPSKLTDFAPLYYESEHAQGVIQFDKDDVEAIGLVKFDFLGLRTLTIIDWAVKNVNTLLRQKGEPEIDILRINMEDLPTFQLLKKCQTTAVFQLESRGMKELIKRLQPDRFEEIIALVALFRPGPLQSGMVDDFINRKHGRQKVEYLHPSIEPILKSTYGVILYQEQVMQIAQVLAGYTLGGADLLRRAMGKKKPEEMAKQRAIFIEGAVKNGADARIATTIFDLMEKFAAYGFNKSHSAAYALVSYQTAWLKAHFPSSFMAAVLSSDMDHTDKVVNMIEECRQCKINIISPDINQSVYAFAVNDKEEIVYGLGAIKGVGEAAILHIIEQRQEQPFQDLFDFCKRIDSKKVNKRVLDSLIKSGALDTLGHTRGWMLANLDTALSHALKLCQNVASGQGDIFQDMLQEEVPLTLHEAEDYPEGLRLQGEKESLGLYFSGHPLQAVQAELKSMQVVKYRDVKSTKKEQQKRFAGIITAIRTMQTKNGDRMAILTLDDELDRFEIAVFPEPYQKNREMLVKDQLVVMDVKVTLDSHSGTTKIRAENIYTLEKSREQFAKKIILHFQDKEQVEEEVHILKESLLLLEKGSCQILIEFQTREGKIALKLGETWHIKPTADAIQHLKSLLPNHVIQLEY